MAGHLFELVRGTDPAHVEILAAGTVAAGDEFFDVALRRGFPEARSTC